LGGGGRTNGCKNLTGDRESGLKGYGRVSPSGTKTKSTGKEKGFWLSGTREISISEGGDPGGEEAKGGNNAREGK